MLYLAPTAYRSLPLQPSHKTICPFEYTFCGFQSIESVGSKLSTNPVWRICGIGVIYCDP